MASTTARIAKDKGNKDFLAGRYAESIGHYSAAILADRSDPTYPLNRAAAYLKLGKHRDAERDCTTVLSLDGKNVKALFRRAQARAVLGTLAEAEKDLKDAMSLDSTNTSVKQELANVNKLQLEVTKKQASSRREPITVPPLSSSAQNKIQTDAPPIRRITRNVPIDIIEPEDAAPEPAPPTELLKPIQSRTFTLSPGPEPVPSDQPHSSMRPFPTPSSRARVGAAIFRADGNHTILRDATPASPAPTTPVPKSPSLPLTSDAPALPTPLTYFTFSRAWHSLRAAQERYELLRRIPPASLPGLFKTSLEPELLVSILGAFEVVASPAVASEIITYMTALTTVPRFGTVVLFLSPKEKDVVRSVWDKLPHGNRGRKLWGV